MYEFYVQLYLKLSLSALQEFAGIANLYMNEGLKHLEQKSRISNNFISITCRLKPNNTVSML